MFASDLDFMTRTRGMVLVETNVLCWARTVIGTQ